MRGLCGVLPPGAVAAASGRRTVCPGQVGPLAAACPRSAAHINIISVLSERRLVIIVPAVRAVGAPRGLGLVDLVLVVRAVLVRFPGIRAIDEVSARIAVAVIGPVAILQLSKDEVARRLWAGAGVVLPFFYCSAIGVRWVTVCQRQPPVSRRVEEVVSADSGQTGHGHRAAALARGRRGVQLGEDVGRAHRNGRVFVGDGNARTLRRGRRLEDAGNASGAQFRRERGSE